MLVVDGNGLPLGLHVDSANMAEVTLAAQTLDTLRVARPRGRPKRRPEKVVVARGYDGQAFRAALRRRGIGMCIPPKRRPATWKAKRGCPVVARKEEYRLRYTVEHSFAWLGNFRHLVIRWDHCYRVYRSRCHDTVCAPSDCPRVPDPVGLSRARAVDEARSVQPSWSTNGSGPHQRMR